MVSSLLSLTNALDLPPRLQFEANSGYCGEVSFITAGLYYGQYCSQYDARALASPGVPQSSPDSQLLLGENDVKAATAMRLKSMPFNTDAQTTSDEFLVWIEKQTNKGYPVTIGVFYNHFLLEEDDDPQAGEQEYDHIVPVISVTPNSDQSKKQLVFSDNGLYTPDDTPTYIYKYAFGDIFMSREDSNAEDGPAYSLNDSGENYGIAITGVQDLQGDTIPVRLTTDKNYESPEMVDGSNKRPAAMPLTLRATVKIPDQNVGYNLYLYKSFAATPTSKFNAQASKASKVWKIAPKSGATYSVQLNIMSNEIAVFRSVRSKAP